MPLVPEYEALFASLAEEPAPPLSEMSPAEGREMYRAMRPVVEDLAVDSVEDRTIADGLAIRVFRPAGSGDTALPVLVNYHGGGWVIGDLDTADAACRHLANAVQCVVVSVDYRLAPEHRYPAAVEDSYAALVWAAEHGEALGGNGKLAVGGESAGGNLAAVVSQQARDRNGPRIDAQLLLYPVVDCDMTRQSYVDNGEGYLLTTDSMHWFWNHYCPDATQREEPAASPLRGALDNLAPALVVTAEFDPLRDEGAAYAEAMQAAGSSAELLCYDGLVHDFFATAHLFESSRSAFEEVCGKLRTLLDS